MIGIDLLDIDPIPGVDVHGDGLPRRGRARAAEGHDGRPGRRGHVRHGRQRHRPQEDRPSDASSASAELAIDFAREVLAPGGAFVAKVLQGGTEGTLLTDLKRDFASSAT